VVSPHIEAQLRAELERLPQEKQQRVLAFARSLANVAPEKLELMSGAAFMQSVAGLIPSSDLEEMARAIEEDCGRIDPDEW